MGSIGQHDRGVPIARGSDLPRAVLNRRRARLGTGFGRRLGVDQDFVGPRQVLPLGKWKNLQSTQIEGRDVHLSSLPKKGSRLKDEVGKKTVRIDPSVILL